MKFMEKVLALALIAALFAPLAASSPPPQQQQQSGQPPAAPDAPVEDTRPFKATEVTRRAAVVFRPGPLYTEEARKNHITGTVSLRLVRNSDGTVSDIAAVSRLPHGLTEMAAHAARGIKFIPAERDGRRVSQWVTFQYNFNIY